jgi:hypothetical protein
MLVEGLLDDPTLDTLAAAMDQTDQPEPCLVGGAEVVIDDELHVARREGVEVQRVFERNLQIAMFLPGSCRTRSRPS